MPAQQRGGFADSELLQAIGIGAVWLFISLPVYGFLAKRLAPVGFWAHLGLVLAAAAVPPLLLVLLMAAERVWDLLARKKHR